MTQSDTPLEPKVSLIERVRRGVLFLMQRQMGKDIQDIINTQPENNEGLSETERDLIQAALTFDDVEAEDVAVPRSDVAFVRASDNFDDILDLFASSRYSRLPVCGKDLDDVIGFLSIKDMIPFIKNPDNFKVTDVMRPCTFVSDSQIIPEVLEQMRRNKVSFAIVVDEFGGTAGLITLKDIVAELVGDIEDEDEENSDQDVVSLGNNLYSIDPKTRLDDLNEHIPVEFVEMSEDQDFDTIGGYILNLAGRVPSKGDVFMLNSGAEVTIMDADPRRIKRMELRLPHPPPQGELPL